MFLLTRSGQVGKAVAWGQTLDGEPCSSPSQDSHAATWGLQHASLHQASPLKSAATFHCCSAPDPTCFPQRTGCTQAQKGFPILKPTTEKHKTVNQTIKHSSAVWLHWGSPTQVGLLFRECCVPIGRELYIFLLVNVISNKLKRRGAG